ALAGTSAPPAFDLGTVEVVGVRESRNTNQTTDSITAGELSAKHRNNLAEALDLVPGVSSQNVGQRRERLINVRGFSSRQVPLYIDGVPVYVPYDGNVDLARFGIDYVAQIVVSKGLASLLYGPNIVGGAINVVSRKPANPFEASARSAWEVDDRFDSVEQRVGGSLGGIHGNWYGNITLSYADSDGYRLAHGFAPVAAEDGGRRENATSRDSMISAKIGYAADAGNEYALSYYRQSGAKQDPPYAGSYLRNSSRPDGMTPRYWIWPYWNKESVYFVARNAITSQGSLRWRLFHDTFRNAIDSYDDATYTTQTRPYAFHDSHYDDYTWGGSADFEWRWNAAHITQLAMHFRQDVHREAQSAPLVPLQRLEIPTYDVAVEHEWRPLGALSLTPSYSHMIQPARTAQVYTSSTGTFSPVNTDRSSADNAQLVASWRLDELNSVFAGLSRKTRFPTIKERFSGGMGTAVPNPGLEPESAVHVELGYQHQGETGSAELAVFESRLRDAIQSVSMPPSTCGSPPCSQLQNVARRRNRGFEVSANYMPIPTLQLSGQVSLVDIANLGSPGVRPTGTPQTRYQVAGDWNFLPRWHLRANARHDSDRYSNSTGTRVAEAFTLVDAFLRFIPTEHLGIDLGVRNATDALYAYDEGFYEAGRAWLLQVDWRR
ncbi:MAG: TonB-dependent receptor, partial [Gammaproteobacteria bacterium]|nr:TonB-dependent receptor [Gammaproteobacteria bacterium]